MRARKKRKEKITKAERTARKKEKEAEHTHRGSWRAPGAGTNKRLGGCS